MSEVCIEGRGLHSGAPVRVVLRRLEGQGSAIVFRHQERRVGLGASAARAASGSLATDLEAGGIRLRTVEHLSSALCGLGVGGVEVELVGGVELPGAGGDGRSWVEAAARLQLEPLARFCPPWPLEVRQGASWARWTPGPKLSVSYAISFVGSVIGEQALALELTPEAYVKHIAGARTFASAPDLERFHAQRACGVGLGLGPEEGFVAGPEGFLVGKPRFEDEAVRHKVLDLIGDLGVLGVRPLGHLEVSLGGHSLHRALARAAAELVEFGVHERAGASTKSPYHPTQ